jgi:hypothetical protein
MLTHTFTDVVGNREVYMDCLNAIIGEKRNSMIDLGCNLAPHTPLLGFSERAYYDILDRVLDYPEERIFFTKQDILEVVPSKVVDVAFALDVIEHLTIEDGYKLLSKMEKYAHKQILFTPLTDLFGFDYDTPDPEAHRSLWNPEMSPQYASIIFPDYHRVWNGGAYFFWKSENIEQEFESVLNILKNREWAK